MTCLTSCASLFLPYLKHSLKYTVLLPSYKASRIKVMLGQHKTFKTSAPILVLKGKKRPFDVELERADVETSKKYLESEAYKITYGNAPVWLNYRRNFKGQFAPKLTRLACIKDGMFVTGNPCPICRDRYLMVDYQNPKLLEQFISPYTGEILKLGKTQVCQEQQLKIVTAIQKSKMHGFLSHYVPHREYDYSEYYNNNPN